MGWTPEQEKAISTPTGRGNILVSAAAGSGKTAVLVERVMRKLIGGASIDRLLIVTFTNAAAAEMREKIIKRLIAALDDAPDEETARHLKKQVQLSESADIMTIDAFCIRMVQNNFHVLGADSNIGIADTTLAEFIAAEAMDNLLDRMYKLEDKSRFNRLTAAYSTNRSDSRLGEVILKIYKFINSFAEPEKWLDQAAAAYRLPPLETPYAKQLLRVSKRAAAACLDALSESDDGSDCAAQLNAAAGEILAAEDWDGVYSAYNTYFNKKSTGFIKPLKSGHRLNYIYSIFKDRLGGGVTFDSAKLQDKLKNLPKLAGEAEDIVWIVKEFMAEYAALKDRRGVREFADIEHMTFDLFKNHEDIREIYKAKYDEILIDEYQDTNGLQDSIFELISKDNIFMVGDLKQSIYGFRGGDPYIFKAKSELYSSPATPHTKITLAQNFRSRQEVLKSVNDVFTAVMSNEAGDVDYRGDELIVRDAEREYYPAADSDCRAELHYFIAPTGEGVAEEVRFTVAKIKELLESGITVYDTSTGKMRPIRKKDIVILENTTKHNGELLVSELSRLGIDAYCDTEAFFSRREINVMMSLISLINNARQDIPLLTVMRSPIGGFTDNELARIRICAGKTKDFTDAVYAYMRCRGMRCVSRNMHLKSKLTVSRKRKQRRLLAKCRRLIGELHRWRGYVRHKSVAQLIWTIYEESCFYDMMGVIEHGEEAQFNLKLLYDRAKQYEKAGFKGLFSFIKYIEMISAMDKDLGGAKMIGENHDVVRIMTIHKSKGLEFPYVFVLNTGADFPKSSGFAAVRQHKELMFGLRDVFAEEHYARDTVISDYIKELNKQERRAESMRLAYVALTRAREKLYVLMCPSPRKPLSQEEILEKHTESLIDGRMLPSDALKVSGIYGWLCPAAFTCPKSWKYEFHEFAVAESAESEAEIEVEGFEDSEELKAAVFDILDYKYPYTNSNTIPSRTSVTQIKELTIERESIDSPVYEPDSRRSSGADDMAELMFSPLHQKPAFMREKGGKPANEIGTLYHNIMAETDLGRVRAEGADCVDSEITRLEAEEIISAEDRDYIDTDKIKGFYTSPLGQRMLASSAIHREAPFQINISAAEYDPSLPAEYSDETVILQGITDCFFKEGDGYILLDYKTDKIHGSSDIIRHKYAKQLELYTKAIEKLTGCTVREKYLYLFDTGEAIMC